MLSRTALPKSQLRLACLRLLVLPAIALTAGLSAGATASPTPPPSVVLTGNAPVDKYLKTWLNQPALVAQLNKYADTIRDIVTAKNISGNEIKDTIPLQNWNAVSRIVNQSLQSGVPASGEPAIPKTFEVPQIPLGSAAAQYIRAKIKLDLQNAAVEVNAKAAVAANETAAKNALRQQGLDLAQLPPDQAKALVAEEVAQLKMQNAAAGGSGNGTTPSATNQLVSAAANIKAAADALVASSPDNQDAQAVAKAAADLVTDSNRAASTANSLSSVATQLGKAANSVSAAGGSDQSQNAAAAAQGAAGQGQQVAAAITQPASQGGSPAPAAGGSPDTNALSSAAVHIGSKVTLVTANIFDGRAYLFTNWQMHFAATSSLPAAVPNQATSTEYGDAEIQLPDGAPFNLRVGAFTPSFWMQNLGFFGFKRGDYFLPNSGVSIYGQRNQSYDRYYFAGGGTPDDNPNSQLDISTPEILVYFRDGFDGKLIYRGSNATAPGSGSSTISPSTSFGDYGWAYGYYAGLGIDSGLYGPAQTLFQNLTPAGNFSLELFQTFQHTDRLSLFQQTTDSSSTVAYGGLFPNAHLLYNPPRAPGPWSAAFGIHFVFNVSNNLSLDLTATFPEGASRHYMGETLLGGIKISSFTTQSSSNSGSKTNP